MFDWLKQLVGGPHSLRNSAGLPAEVLNLTAQDLARIQSKDAALSGRALAYVVDGDHPGVISDIGTAFRKGGWMYTTSDDDRAARAVRWKLYDQWSAVPSEFWVRFGQVLAASSSPIHHRPALTIAAQYPWVEALATDLVAMPLTHFGQPDALQSPHPAATMQSLEALLASVGAARHELVLSTFSSFPKRGNWRSAWARSAEFTARLAGFEASAVREAERVQVHFRDPIFDNRAYVLRLLRSWTAEGLAVFADQLVDLSLDSSATVRAGAVPLALRAGAPAIAVARRYAVDQKPEGRARALALLWQAGDPDLREFVRERGTADAAESVRAAVTMLDRAVLDAPATLDVPPVDLRLDAPLSRDAERELRAYFAAYNSLTLAERQRADEKWKKNWVEISRDAIDDIVGQVASPSPSANLRVIELRSWVAWQKLAGQLGRWARRDDVTLAHVVRLLISTAWIPLKPARHGAHHLLGPSEAVINQCGRVPGKASLLMLEQIFAHYGVPRAAITVNWFNPWGQGLTREWPDDAIWPFFQRNRDVIDEALNPSNPLRRDYSYEHTRAYDALATFPVVPHDLIPLLFDFAVGPAKADRVGAQRVLDRTPDIDERIVEALGSGKADIRAAAATWLGRRRATQAIEPLTAALKKEKHDFAAGALMSALETLGVPVAQFLKRDALEKEAQAGLKKGVPADISWFPFDHLPPLVWSDTGAVVSGEIARWWVVQACRLKTPEPGAVLRHYFAALQPTTREAFSLFVLHAWMRADVNPISRAEAESLARTQAQATISSIKAYPQYYTEEQKAASEEQYYEAFLPAYLARPAGSAIGAKGVLAVVAAGGGSEIAPVVHRYLKEWYGTRAAQGKALIQMLAWVDHPTATQLVLSIGSRFRTKGFQEEATRQAELLAERRGWTLDELSDRTIPSAGFDADGVAEIDYGTRKFTARLGADFDVTLYSPEGKQISSLPDARKDEDEAAIKAAKKSWSAARKELKGVLQLQKDRLYEALCTERSWAAEDWQLYLNRHPIVRYYCQRLVWTATSQEGSRRTFRPLDDGSLTSETDDSVELGSSDRIALAHDTNLNPQLVAAWQQHLRDYKVEPLFQQFGKGEYRLPSDRRDQTEIDDFLGHVLEAFALRGRASKLGYTRGAAEDGGWFFRYEKRFPTLGITAEIEFTGNGLPEENRLVALKALAFRHKAGDEQMLMPLGDVPRVLLGECWNDLRMLAADGPGFDPEWEKKTEP